MLTPLRFGDFALDPDRRLLSRGGTPLHLSPKGFQLLLLLVENRPKAVSKEDIQDRLWPDSLVTESALSVLVAEVRSALSDDARKPRYIRTLHRFGYAFSGEAAARAANADVHRIVHEGREIELHEGENVVGRDRDVRVFIADPSVSRRHAVIVVASGKAVLHDLQSKNATLRQDERVGRDPVELQDGDRLRFGWVTVVYRRFLLGSSTVTRQSGMSKT